MPARTLLATGVAVLLLLALVPACEDTDVTAPANSTIILTAIPASIQIDQDAGESVGSTQIYATVLDTGGLPLEDILVVFSSTGGRLDSENFCNADGDCTRTGENCVDDDDCPPPAAPAVKTNENGVATDRLTLRLIEDPDTVDVTAQISVVSKTVTVAKIVNLGPADPVAVIEAVPPTGQRTGLPFALDGTQSTFDPQVELTCFEWTIDSNIGADQIIRGADKSIISLTLGTEGEKSGEQDLTVTLRVSDVPGIVCNNVTTPNPADFSTLSDVIAYQVRCDLTDPIVEAGPNQSESLSANAGEVSVNLTATASDPESDTLSFVWDCGNGTGGTTQSVTCVYDTEGIFAAKVIVQNDCDRVSQDNLFVNINP